MKKALLWLGLLFFCCSSAVSAPTSPQSFLGHAVGADRKLADYGQIRAYFEKLALESSRIRLLEIGTSTLKRAMFMAVITAEQNMAKLDTYREIARKLRDAGSLSDQEAQSLAREGKAIVLITCSLHATEIAASQMSMELAYDLVTGRTPFDANRILNDVIVLLVPSSNPDGNIMVTEWYRKYLGTAYEGGSMPWLYHHYAGHDNNRDWFMMNLAETRSITKIMYTDWIPQVHIDEHQMGSNGARLFLPPFMEPPVPNVQPLNWRGTNLLGSIMAYDLQKNDYHGVSHGRSFTGWWIGACDDTPWLHNTIGILSEMASVRIASPIYIEPTEIPRSYTEKRMEILDPWPGGWWRLRDLVDYELTFSKSLIQGVSREKEVLLYDSYRKNKASITRREKGEPFAFVISANQHDYATTLRMLDILQLGGVIIHQAKEDFHAGNRFYPSGSFLVLLAQPYKPYAWALLDRQKYPDLRQYPGGPPIPPYDNAGWTLPMQMGVSCDRIAEEFQVRMEKLVRTPKPTPSSLTALSASPYLVLDSRNNGSYAVMHRLLAGQAQAWRSTRPISGQGFHAAAGSFLVKNSPEIQKELIPLLEKHRIPVHRLDSIESTPRSSVGNQRIAIYQSWRANMEEGWTRCALDDLGISFTVLHNADIKGKKDEKVDLKDKYDVLIFSGESSDIIKTGKSSSVQDSPGRQSVWPPEYEGGIEKEGIEAVKTFVEKGGILVLINEAAELGFKELGAPARNTVDRLDSSKFFCPTSLVKILVDNTKPIGYGMQEEAAAVFSDSLALSTWLPPSNDWDRSIVATFPTEDILMSGWLLGEEYLSRKAAVVDTRFKKGHIILIGIAGQIRAQSHGTYKFLLNSLFYPQEAPMQTE